MDRTKTTITMSFHLSLVSSNMHTTRPDSRCHPSCHKKGRMENGANDWLKNTINLPTINRSVGSGEKYVFNRYTPCSHPVIRHFNTTLQHGGINTDGADWTAWTLDGWWDGVGRWEPVWENDVKAINVIQGKSLWSRDQSQLFSEWCLLLVPV